MKLGEWIKEHKAIAIGGGLVLLILLYELFKGGSGGGSSSAAANAPVQIAALQSQANLQQAQLAAQSSVAGAQAQVANNQIQAQLAANEQNNLTQLLGPAIQENQAASIMQAQYQSQLAAEQAALNEVTAVQNGPVMGQAKTNVISAILGQGNVASFNNANAQSLAAQEQAYALTKISQNNLLGSLGQGLFSTAGGFLP